MVILRRTAKLAGGLTATPEPLPESTTALGDWYVNRIVIDRSPLLLMVSSRSLLPIVVPAREVRTLPDRLANLVGGRLARVGVPAALIRAEQDAMAPILVGKTTDRSVLGILVDFGKALSYFQETQDARDWVLPAAEDWLAETPCYAGRPCAATVFPIDKTRELMHERWS